MLRAEDIDEPFIVGELEVDGLAQVVPCLEAVGQGGEQLMLHYGNTVVRCFWFNPEINHVEIRAGEKLRGIKLPDDVIEAMLAHGWPARYDPFVDEQTQEWFTTLQMRTMEAELDEML